MPSVLRLQCGQRHNNGASDPVNPGQTRRADSGTSTQGRCAMVILTAFALLALFSIVAIVLSAEDTREDREERYNPLYWASIGRR